MSSKLRAGERYEGQIEEEAAMARHAAWVAADALVHPETPASQARFAAALAAEFDALCDTYPDGVGSLVYACAL